MYTDAEPKTQDGCTCQRGWIPSAGVRKLPGLLQWVGKVRKPLKSRSICSLTSTFFTRASSQLQRCLTATTTAQWLYCRSGEARVLHSLKIKGERELPAWELLQVITNVNERWIGSLESADYQHSHSVWAAVRPHATHTQILLIYKCFQNMIYKWIKLTNKQ